MRNAYSNIIGKLELDTTSGRLGHTIILKWIFINRNMCADWIQLSQHVSQWMAFVKILTNL
jgi:hypothetical protein